MALRNLVTGADACAPSDSASRRGNPLSALADTLFRRTAANQRAEQATTYAFSDFNYVFQGGASSSNYGNFFEELQDEGPSQLQDIPPSLQSNQSAMQDVFNSSRTDPAVHHFNLIDRDLSLSETFKSFLQCAREGTPFYPPHTNSIEFDPIDQQKIRNRTFTLCHHLFADQGSEFAQIQAARFLEAIQIDTIPSGRSLPPMMSGYPAWSPPAGVDWVQEFHKISMGNGGENTWREKEKVSEEGVQQRELSKEEADNISSALIEQMSKDPDPKFRNSKFLEFVKQLNSGEISIEGDKVIRREHMESVRREKPAWMDGSEAWGMDAGGLEGAFEGGWLEDYEIEEWVENFNQMANGPIYQRKEYQFASSNPYLDNSNAFNIAMENYSKGDLSEARLAAEAEIQRDKKSVDAWILLGRIQAENNDDLQAISAFEQAQELDPTNLEVLLDLGVCHANEVHEQPAIDALLAWLRCHPMYSTHPAVNTNPTDPSQALSHALRVFHQVLEGPQVDVEARIACGVLHHLGRDFNKAIHLFQEALQQQHQNHSLWNKLGATQANAANSVEAIQSYQKALEQKPNYMRAWANLGISYANVGDYKASVDHYIHALTLNPNSEAIWQYLKSSAICAGYIDLYPIIDQHDLARLKGFFSR